MVMAIGKVCSPLALFRGVRGDHDVGVELDRIRFRALLGKVRRIGDDGLDLFVDAFKCVFAAAPLFEDQIAT